MALKDRLESDLATFFSEDDFGRVDYVTNGVDPPRKIGVIFEETHFAVLDGEVSLSLRKTLAWAKTSDLTNIRRGSWLMIDGVTYPIIDLKPDGTGVTELELEDRNG